MRLPVVALFCAILSPSRSLNAQAVQAARSVGRAESEAVADAISRAVGELTGQVAALRTLRTRALQDPAPAVVSVAIGLEQIELLAQQAIDRRDDPKAFLRSLIAYQSALASFLSGSEKVSIEGMEPAITARVTALRTMISESLTPAHQRITAIPPAIHQYVPNVLFAIGAGLVDRPDRNERRTVPITISTNLVGQLGGGIIGALGAGDLANYFKDNVVAGAAFEGRIGKPSGQLTAGLGEVHVGKLTFWPVLGFDQSDSSDSRVPSGLRAVQPKVGTWSTPMIAASLTWLPLDAFIAHVKAEDMTPIVTVGLRFPYYYPGNTTDALGALFTDKLSNYVRNGRLQIVIGVDIPLMKVDPSRLINQ
jgi:hypothetical protein